VKAYFDRLSATRPAAGECVIMPPGSSWSRDDGFKIEPFDYARRDEYVEGLVHKYSAKLAAQYAKEEGERADWKAFESYFSELIASTPKIIRRLLPSVSFTVSEGPATPGGKGSPVRHWLVDFKSGRAVEVDEPPSVALSITTPPSVLNDCTKRRMFSTWTASKRLSIRLRDGAAKNLALFFLLLDLFENDGLPLRNLCSRRQLMSRLPRWREYRDVLAIAAKSGLLRRPFRVGDLYAPTRTARLSGSRRKIQSPSRGGSEAARR
jgi:hypothetical protein